MRACHAHTVAGRLIFVRVYRVEKGYQMSRRTILWSLLCVGLIATSSRTALSQERASATRAETPADSSVVIYVPKDGEFYFGGERITQAEIPDRLKGVLKDKPTESQTVSIRAGLGVSYKAVVSLIDTIRGAGFNQIALVPVADSGSKPQAKSQTGGAGKSKKVRRRRRTLRSRSN
jgi:biopolymer transport protein ExbD